MTRASALFALHVAVALFGFAALFGRWVALSPVAIVLGRTVVAAVTLALVLRFERVAAGRPTVGTAANGALLAVHWVTFFAAVQVATVAVALLAFASFPIFVLAGESVQRRRRPPAAAVAATGLVAIGLALLVPAFAWSDPALRGLALGLASGFTFALLALRNRALLRRHGATGLALWQNAFAALWLLPAAAVVGAFVAPTPRDVALLIALGVVCTALAHTLFIASMRRVSAHAASVVAVLEPVYGIALAALFVGETPAPRTLAGATLVVTAALLVTFRASLGTGAAPD